MKPIKLLTPKQRAAHFEEQRRRWLESLAKDR